MSELLVVERLRVAVETGPRLVYPVDDVSFAIRRGETLALLGESGCGKSLTALAMMRLLPSGLAIKGGDLRFAGESLFALSESQMRTRRGRDLAMIFQEPMTSLNPVMTIGDQLVEAINVWAKAPGGSEPRSAGEARSVGDIRSAGDIKDRAVELLSQVQLPDPERRLRSYPHQLSGGMKQRVMIAMALAGDPQLLIADEPTTALDVTVQSEILTLLRGIQEARELALLIISHDLGVVAEMADRVAVMYAGELVEEATVASFFARPAHPYGTKLKACVPVVRSDSQNQALSPVPGQVPEVGRHESGCRFVDRCALALPHCRGESPQWHVAATEQRVRCHLWAEGTPDEFQGRPELEAWEASSPVPDEESGGEASAEHGSRCEDRRLLRVDGLQVYFPIRRGFLRRVTGSVRAVDGISLEVNPGETLALVGESGCGKTTVAKGILGLVKPQAGDVRFAGAALTRSRSELRMIFQDPFASMNPRMRVGEIILEGTPVPKLERESWIDGLLSSVGLPPEAKSRYPHEFSGGQRQRICIARALANRPRLIICDEPTSALDVSIQAQILNLLRRLQEELSLAYLFITHDLGVVSYMAHRVAVMYQGRVVEEGSSEQILMEPKHPYTRQLITAVPGLTPRVTPRFTPRGPRKPSDIESTGGGQRKNPLSPGHGHTTGDESAGTRGDAVDPGSASAGEDLAQGCHYASRCPQALDICKRAYPNPIQLADGRGLRCHLYGN